MKKIILISFISVMSKVAFTQSNAAFAITTEVGGGPAWNVVKIIDLNTGEAVKNLYNPAADKNVSLLNLILDPDDCLNSDRLLPMGQGVAATAYDARHNRLYYTSLRGIDLRYFDLSKDAKAVVINNDKMLNSGNKQDEANIITRMTFCSDGYGYELTNDGNHLIRFTTEKDPVVVDLGPLINNIRNEKSVHAQNSWGGDIVGDLYGNIYLITQHNLVFKINVQTMMADYLGEINGLPANFTTNGAAVDVNGDLILGSVSATNNYFKVRMLTLHGYPLQRNSVFSTSDLASAYLLKEGAGATAETDSAQGNAISLYPNPTVDRTFNIKFKQVSNGQYTLQVIDAMGSTILIKQLYISSPGYTQRIILPQSPGNGNYVIKITGPDKRLVYIKKIVLI